MGSVELKSMRNNVEIILSKATEKNNFRVWRWCDCNNNKIQTFIHSQNYPKIVMIKLRRQRGRTFEQISSSNVVDVEWNKKLKKEAVMEVLVFEIVGKILTILFTPLSSHLMSLLQLTNFHVHVHVIIIEFWVAISSLLNTISLVQVNSTCKTKF